MKRDMCCLPVMMTKYSRGKRFHLFVLHILRNTHLCTTLATISVYVS